MVRQMFHSGFEKDLYDYVCDDFRDYVYTHTHSTLKQVYRIMCVSSCAWDISHKTEGNGILVWFLKQRFTYLYTLHGGGTW